MVVGIQIRPGSEVDIRVLGSDGGNERWTLAHDASVPSDVARGIVSLDAPIALALCGAEVGQTVTVKGPKPYKVLILDAR